MNLRDLCSQLLKKTLIIVILAVAVVVIVFPQTASALCIQPDEEGSWRNTDPQTRSITRVELRFVCQDQILNGQPYPPGPPWYHKRYTKI
ncbi:MAG TPA: hypothetical protein DCF68_21985 [Cyanothece sp. UBA12306]|nr:hypothetical protein [Cyanothece sp. UBA12306]